MLAPGKQQTHRAYIWAYSTTSFADTRAVVYHFAPSRAGEHARDFFGYWSGKLVCDDYAGYKASFGQGITEIGCMAHARRKFFDLHVANKSTLAAEALALIGQLYGLSVRQRGSTPRIASDDDRSRPVPLRVLCTAGYWPSDNGCPTVPPRPKPWITASSAGQP